MRLPSGGALHLEGRPGAGAVVLLHGVAGGAWSWRPQRSALARSARLYVWEARGHGAAAPVRDAGLADYFVDAREALRAAVDDAGEPAVLVAHSMGGLLALALAAETPAAVRGLFLIEPVYATGEGAYGHLPPALGRIVRVPFLPLLRSFARDGAASRVVARCMFSLAFENRARCDAAWPDQRTQRPVEYPRMLAEAFDGPTGFALRDFAREIGAPTFVLESSVALRAPRFPQLTRTLGERLGSAFEHEAIRGGHYLQLDQPDAVNARLAAFLARCAL